MEKNTIRYSKIKRIVAKLYLSVSIVLTLILGVLLYANYIDGEQRQTEIFKNAHNSIEARYPEIKVIFSDRLTLDENRELQALESAMRLNSKQAIKLDTNEVARLSGKERINYIYDFTCFDYYGNLVSVSSEDDCNYKISDMHPGNVLKATLISIGTIIGFIIALILFKKWFMWLTK